MEALKDRLIKRGTESIAEINKRLKLGEQEMLKYKLYDYVVTNVEVDETVSIIQSIMRAEEYRTKRFLK